LTGRRRERALTYPTDHLLAVIDDPAAADAAVAALRSGLGLPPGDVTLLAGDAAAERIDGLGRSHGLGTRLLRIVQFATMDQMPDFQLYEAAIADGRAVLAVRVRDRATMLAARDRLAGVGAHFMNLYGRFYTEELSRWRGPELDLPGYLRR
jgi:hypothetical protein